MTRKGLERGLVALLFVMVLIVFSFAERDSKKMERLYNMARVLQKAQPADLVSQHPLPTKPLN